MARKSFSNPYNIASLTVLPVKNEKVVDYSIKTDGKWLSHFYLVVQFKNTEDLRKFEKNLMPQIEAKVKKLVHSRTVVGANSKGDQIFIPVPCRWGKNHIAIDPKRTNTLITFLNEICRYDFQPALDNKRNLEQRNSNSWSGIVSLGLGYLVGVIPIIAFPFNPLSYLAFAACGFIGMALAEARVKFKTSCNEEYLNKNDEAIEALTDQQKKSFDIGIRAANSYLVQFESCIQPASVLHPKAYYAGMVAGQVDSPMEKEIKEKLKVSI